MDVMDHLGDKDLSKRRTIDLDNGNKINLEQRDPYGLIHVWLDKGSFPDKSPLHGTFTSWDWALRAVDGYINQRNEAVSEVRQIHPKPIQDRVGPQPKI